MRKTILLTASALAFMVAGAAYAQDGVSVHVDTGVSANGAESKTAGDVRANETTTQEFKEGVAGAVKNAGEVIKDVGQTAKSAVQELTADFINKDETPASVKFENRMTAKGMIGEDVLNTEGTKVATVKDIILDKDGRAQMVVVSDGGVLGIGDKLAAFNYGSVISQQADGDVIMPLSKETIGKVAEFTYKPENTDAKTLVMPAGGYSADAILDGNLLDSRGEKVAKVENIMFRQGGHARVVVAYDQTLGMGGKLAAFDFGDLELVRKDTNDVDFKMNASQSAKFEKYKKEHKG